jgi:membrane protein YdbS with pleckstrin-like domain
MLYTMGVSPLVWVTAVVAGVLALFADQKHRSGWVFAAFVTCALLLILAFISQLGARPTAHP